MDLQETIRSFEKAIRDVGPLMSLSKIPGVLAAQELNLEPAKAHIANLKKELAVIQSAWEEKLTPEYWCKDKEQPVASDASLGNF